MARAKLILLVEDDSGEEELMRQALAKSRFAGEVVVAKDGKQALDFLLGPGRDEARTPAVTLLDLNLPKLDGLEVLRRLRADARTRLLPVVILTTSRDERDRREGYAGGANSFVCKPVDFHELADAVGQLSRYWLDVNEPPPPPMM